MGLRGAICAAAILAASRAIAAPEEIEVYRDGLNARGGLTLEANQSYVFSGDEAPDFPGGQASAHRYRLTPELSYGLTPSLEVGALTVLTVDARGRAGAHGLKARLRYIDPHTDHGLYWGANLEAGCVDRTQSETPCGAELRGILGYEGRRWVLAVNPILEGGVGGTEPVSAELDAKLAYRVGETLLLGVESYNGFGPVRGFAPLKDTEHMLYLAADLELKGVELNIGLGHGLGRVSDGWVAKTVVAIPLR
jgi:hypothetical protein